MDDKFLIHVDIVNKSKPYPLWIERKDEELVRNAVKKVRILANEYRQHFSYANDLGSDDFLAMTALQFAIEALRLEAKNDTKPYSDKIEQLTKEIENYLEDNR